MTTSSFKVDLTKYINISSISNTSTAIETYTKPVIVYHISVNVYVSG